MDMNVDTKAFASLRNDIDICQKRLQDASNSLNYAVSAAGQSLEGRQYSLSVEETQAACAVIDASVSNLSQMEMHLSRLEAHVMAYLNCKYNG